jgi:hydroxymethylglutaryl-CoA reductase
MRSAAVEGGVVAAAPAGVGMVATAAGMDTDMDTDTDTGTVIPIRVSAFSSARRFFIRVITIRRITIRITRAITIHR